MGMNLCVMHLTTSLCHPEWDDDKYSIDKVIVDLFRRDVLPLTRTKFDAFAETYLTPERPTDLAIWKLNVKFIRVDDAEETGWLRERVSTLIKILENNPEFGVYISV